MTAEQARRSSSYPTKDIRAVYTLIQAVAHKATSCYVSEELMSLHKAQLERNGYKFNFQPGCVTVLISWSK